LLKPGNAARLLKPYNAKTPKLNSGKCGRSLRRQRRADSDHQKIYVYIA
jgi:hypothetical protein